MTELGVPITSADADYAAPVPIELPRAGRLDRYRRAATTAGTFVRHVGVPVARRRRGEVPRGLRVAFEHLGSTYVKFGQLIGSSPGAFGQATSDEFRSCLDKGPSVPFAEVRAVVERELGAPLAATFSSFDETPLAAASIAVVHRATLGDGTAVAVKVLRPGVRHRVATDLDVMEPLFRFLALQGIAAAGPMYRFLHGFRRQVAEELDLRNEARTMAHFRALYDDAGLVSVVVPQPRLVTESVLVMDLLDGVPIDDPEQIERMGHDPRPLVQELLRSWFLTGLRDGMFHGDIHAGNLMMLRDGRIGLVDWGIVGVLDERTRWLFRRFVEAILGDATGWADVQEFIADLLPGGDDDGSPVGPRGRRPFDDGETREIEDLLTKPFGEVDLTGAFRGPSANQGRGLGRDGEAPRPARRERAAHRRRLKQWRRKAFADGLLDSDVLQADFLLFKQLLYFERYGKMYLSDVALLGDREYLEAVLAMPQRRLPS